ncbi:MAG TPA: 3-hydroxyacyl-CoA dehydrogenase/enoyl-CoA hydratase family protein [Steroidobacteraceae bacterium]|nr:3-hydroxyacyl-CoA dehydrogenase/enoyl-CoA hydratase family protein [Steroidobacteraceae bacterium]
MSGRLDEKVTVRRAAVLGAGVMGAQIAAHLIDARVPTVLFDLPAKEGERSSIAAKAIEGLKKLQPSPLASRETAALIQPANYDEHLALLGECDLVIEAIAERLEWKTDLYRKVAPHLGRETLFTSNTSGLSIAKLAQALPQELRPRFCGVHFFNPPRYMHLAEIIPCAESLPVVLDGLERFLVTTLGKGVIRAKDTPNFVANRIGVFSMLVTMANAEKLGIRFDVVDDLTGPRLGRPKSATFRTADVVGLDTLAHVVKTMEETLPEDPWHELFRSPPWLTRLIEAGALGAKTRGGVYRKKGNELTVLDPASGRYVEAGGKADPNVAEILKLEDPGQRLERLRASDHPQAQFLWACLRDTFHYSAYHLGEIAHSARDLDLAMRWGFGWKLGPFEIWQAAGWPQVARWIDEDIEAGRTLADAALPAWAREPDRQGVHFPAGCYDAASHKLAAPSTLDVYRRQLVPDTVLGAGRAVLGETVWENPGVRAFTTGDEVLVVSFKTKAHAIGPEVLEGVNRAIEIAEEGYKGLVLWQSEPPFSVGANLDSLRSGLAAGDWQTIEGIIALFQKTSMRLRYSAIPTVAATQGYVFGGGCEFVLHCDRVVAALESYVGLVEAGVGLLPAGGGCKELALRAARESKGDLFASLKDYYLAVATAKVAGSALEAQELGLLRASDVVLFNSGELLHVARQQALALYEGGYRPPLPGRRFPVAGRTGTASIKGQLVNMLEGHFISEYDFEIGSRIAEVMTGGDLEPGTEVTEEWLLALERRHFLALLKSPKTQERIAHTLATGKPLRN